VKFTLNQPFETDQPAVDVDPGLPPGPYRFQLVVVDQAGRRSKPTEVVVTIAERTVTPPVVVDPRIVAPATPIPGRIASPLVAPTPPVTPRRRPRRPNP
jgi:hypothetical protein